MLVRRRSVLFLVDYDRVFRCPPGAHVDFALKAVRKRWWCWRDKGVWPARTGYVMFLYSMWARSRIWVLDDRCSPALTTHRRRRQSAFNGSENPQIPG